MLWFVESTTIGQADTTRVCVRADSWQRALEAVRHERGQSLDFGSFSIELDEGTVRATDALALSGAAHLAGLHDCRVLLPCAESGAAGGLNVRSSVQVAGDVRNGLPVVRPGELPGIGTELVVPTAALAPEPGPGQPRHRWPSADVPVAIPTRSLPELASVGAAIARPMAWLDEVAFIESAAQLDRIRRDAEERATGIVMANGAAPGTAHLTELSTVAVPYSPSGTVRIRVRVVGADDPSAQPAEPAGPALGSGAGCSAPEKRP